VADGVDPLRYRFRVACSPQEAFRLWTAAVGAWWPMSTHSVSGKRDATLVLEPWVGGRIFERVNEGREFEWGSVLVFEPPERLLCEWMVADLTTELEVRFWDDEDGGTVVELEHRGWDRFGDEAAGRRDTNAVGWEGVLPFYVAACGSGPAATIDGS
jgi:Activator of Hsp90 ATPase homolog 1-like protein